MTTEPEWLKELLSQTPDDVVCTMCQRYQAKYGKLPARIAVSHKVQHLLTKEEGEYCSPIVVFFLPDKMVDLIPHGRYVWMLDEWNVVKESV